MSLYFNTFNEKTAQKKCFRIGLTLGICHLGTYNFSVLSFISL